jgi:hypothetical protein
MSQTKELIERLKDIARQRAQTNAPGGSDPEVMSEWIAASLLASQAEEIERLRAGLVATEAENSRIRAALAVSKDPCVYCALPADEMAKCAHGFPACGRADDMLGCPELGASLEVERLTGERDKALEAMEIVLTGGNHLANLLIGSLGARFSEDYPPGSKHMEVRAALTSENDYDAWCCWNAIMRARSVLQSSSDRKSPDE